MAASYGVPSSTCRSPPRPRPQAEARLLELVRDLDVPLVVLARYMQVLSDGLCREPPGGPSTSTTVPARSFRGAGPTTRPSTAGSDHRATAHYVTAASTGPIIEQDVIRVDHSYHQDGAVAAGRDVEAQVLSLAVRWHSQSRVLLNGSRTVVFR